MGTKVFLPFKQLFFSGAMYKETKVQDLELQRNIESNKEKARKGNRKKWTKNNQLFTQENRKYMKRC